MSLKKTILVIDKDYQETIFLNDFFVGEIDVLTTDDESMVNHLIDSKKENLSIILISDTFIKENITSKDIVNEIKALKIPLMGIVSQKNGEEKKFLELGINDLLYKPFTYNDVFGKIVDIVRKDETQKQLQIIMDNITAGVLLVDVGETFKCLYVNKGFLNFCVYDEEKYAQNVQSYISNYIFFDDETFVRNQLLQSVRDNKPFSFDFED